MPKISVVVPVLNKKEYLETALRSIFTQNYPNLEVIIQDGASSDGTLEIIKRYAQNYPKVITWESKKDKGQTDAINRGLRKAKGEILAFLNADDIYKEGALKKVGEYFKRYRQTLWLAGKGNIIDATGKELTPWVTKYKNWLLAKNEYRLLLMTNYLVQPSVFISRQAYKKYGPFTGKKTVMEYDLWLKMGKRQMPKIISSYLSSFRLGKGSFSATSFKEILAEDEKVMRKYTDSPILIIAHYLHNIARVATLYLLNPS